MYNNKNKRTKHITYIPTIIHIRESTNQIIIIKKNRSQTMTTISQMIVPQ